jgi:aminoglycoside phosphotransferase (APT) family kinase protein
VSRTADDYRRASVEHGPGNGTGEDRSACVREALMRELGPTLEIEGFEELKPTETSSYRTEVVTLRLRDGDRLRIFLKDFGACAHDKGDMPQRRLRELCVYRDLLAAARLGTPQYHGAVWQERRGRFWLLLEYVEGESLRYQGFDRWLDAARWLGWMQSHFRRAELDRADFLVTHDAAFFAAVVEDALLAVSAVSHRLGARLRAALPGYQELIPLMAAEPATLVHGVYRPYNILVRRNAERGAICVTDWEESARGSPLYDLAQLTDGFDLPRLHVLIDGYEGELAAAGVALRPREEVLRLLQSFNLHRNLKTLTKSWKRRFPVDGVVRLVARAEELAGGVR